MRQIIIISFVAFITFCNIIWAEGVSCIPMKIKTDNKNIILPEAGKVYFFKNTGQQGVWMDHPQAEHSVSAGWASYLRTGNWSAFFLNRKDFAMSCALIEPGKVNYLDCSKVISICSPKEANFATPPKTKGSYWLAEDKSWDDVVKAVKKRGLVLH